MGAQAELLVPLLVLARALPVGLSLAFMTRKLVPPPVALSLCLSLALGFAAGTSLAAPAQATPVLSLLLLALRELCVGAVFALALSLPVAAAGWAARLSELASWGGATRSGPLSTLYALSAGFLVLSLGAHRALVRGLGASLVDAPLGSLALDRRAFAFGVVQLLVDAFAFALALSLPLLFSLWVIDAGLALVARAFGVATGQVSRSPLRAPVFVLLAALLLAPLVARVPEAMRAGLARARELTRQMTK